MKYVSGNAMQIAKSAHHFATNTNSMCFSKCFIMFISGSHYLTVSDVYISGNLVGSGGSILNDNNTNTCVTIETAKCATFKDVKYNFLSILT